MSDATDVANHALIMALIKHVSASNAEIFKAIMRSAIAEVQAGNIDESTAATAKTAARILQALSDAQIKAMTPESAIGPNGFQTRVL